MAEPAFKFDATSVYLTYAQCPGKKEDLLAFIQRKNDVSKYVVCEETHADGSPHLHGAFQFEGRVKHADPRYWDWLGHHPNIARPRSIAKVAKYIRKHGNFIANATWTLDIHDTFPAAIAASSGRDEFIQHVLASDKLSNRWNNAVGIANHLWPESLVTDYVPEWPAESYVNRPDGLDEWVQQNLVGKRSGPVGAYGRRQVLRTRHLQRLIWPRRRATSCLRQDLQRTLTIDFARKAPSSQSPHFVELRRRDGQNRVGAVTRTPHLLDGTEGPQRMGLTCGVSCYGRHCVGVCARQEGVLWGTTDHNANRQVEANQELLMGETFDFSL